MVHDGRFVLSASFCLRRFPERPNLAVGQLEAEPEHSVALDLRPHASPADRASGADTDILCAYQLRDAHR